MAKLREPLHKQRIIGGHDKRNTTEELIVWIGRKKKQRKGHFSIHSFTYSFNIY